MINELGLNWRINRVEKSSFYLNSDIETLITNVEQVNTTGNVIFGNFPHFQNVINELEGGNRHAGMKRLKVPPLSEKQNAGTTFCLGFYLGTFLVLAMVIILSWYHSYVYGSTQERKEPKWVAVRLYRGFFLLFFSVFLCGLNMYGWAAAGVNHVLIFEVDPRNHLQYQTIMQIAAFMLMLWAICVLGYQHAHYLYLPPLIFPLILMVRCYEPILRKFVMLHSLVYLPCFFAQSV